MLLETGRDVEPTLDGEAEEIWDSCEATVLKGRSRVGDSTEEDSKLMTDDD